MVFARQDKKGEKDTIDSISEAAAPLVTFFKNREILRNRNKATWH